MASEIWVIVLSNDISGNEEVTTLAERASFGTMHNFCQAVINDLGERAGDEMTHSLGKF